MRTVRRQFFPEILIDFLKFCPHLAARGDEVSEEKWFRVTIARECQEDTPVVYRLLRGIARLALHVFSRRIEVEGLEHVPADGPVLFVANHPNVLVDPLLPVISLSRRVTLTATHSLRKNPVRRRLTSAVGVIPFLSAPLKRYDAA